MKPAPFAYVAPESVDEALALVRRYGDDGKVLAGGQSLVPMLNMRLAHPSVLIDLNRITALDYITNGSQAHTAANGSEVRIGAMTRQRTVESSPLVHEHLPLLAEAVRHIGHPQIRNRGTIGGSLAHADPAAELPAVLAALDGTVVARSSKGTRQIRPEAFFIGYLTTALRPDELLVEVRLPAHGRSGWAFLEVARRHGDFALVGVAAVVEVDGDKLRRVRLVFTGVGGSPVRVEEAEAAATGATPGDAVFAEVGRIVRERLEPESDIHATAEYRKVVGGVLAERALRAAVARARERRRP